MIAFKYILPIKIKLVHYPHLFYHSVEWQIFGITDLTAYVLTVLVLIALPGPNSMFCFGTALAHGFAKAKFAIMGTFLGNGTLIVASALGAGALLTRYPFLFGAIKMAGAAYLTYLGGRLLLNMIKLGKVDKPSPAK